jgi:tRNA (mo5U34)-methyltransferase
MVTFATMIPDIREDDSLRENVELAARLQRQAFASSGWWHSIDLGDGLITAGVHPLEHFRDNYARFKLPHDLTGKRVLDIGCWDGFYSFEAERHGAEVVAIDCWRPETFLYARRELGSRAEFHEMSVYELNRESLGTFEIVLFLGVLYHLPDPFLALRRVCEMTRETAVIESHVIDHVIETSHPVMEFYEVDELGGQYDNWWGPNLQCLVRMIRAAGFVRTEVLRHESARAVVKAYRRWEARPVAPEALIRIHDVVNTVMLDRRLVRRGRFALLSIFVEGLPDTATRDTVEVEIGEFGSKPIYIHPPIKSLDSPHARINRLAAPGVQIEPEVIEAALTYTQIIAPVPPGLDAGSVTLKVRHAEMRSDDLIIQLSENGEW